MEYSHILTPSHRALLGCENNVVRPKWMGLPGVRSRVALGSAIGVVRPKMGVGGDSLKISAEEYFFWTNFLACLLFCFLACFLAPKTLSIDIP